MSRPLRTMLIGLGLFLTTSAAALDDLVDVNAGFSDGQTVSAEAFNDLFSAIGGNFGVIANAIEQARASITAQQNAFGTFTGNLAGTSCDVGQVVQAISAAGAISCVDLPAPPEAPVEVTASLARAAVFSVNNSTSTTVPFDAVRFASTGTYSAGQPTRLTAPVSGIYQVSANISWPNVDGLRMLSFAVNGDAFPVLSETRTGPITHNALSGLIQLEAGDYVEVRVYHEIGAGTSFIAATPQTSFQFVRVAGIP